MSVRDDLIAEIGNIVLSGVHGEDGDTIIDGSGPIDAYSSYIELPIEGTHRGVFFEANVIIEIMEFGDEDDLFIDVDEEDGA